MTETTASSPKTTPETWLQEHGDALYAFAMKRVRDANLAEELVQETLLAAMEGRDSFAGRSTERTWLTGILKYKVLQHFRRAGRATKEVVTAECEELVAAQFTRWGKWKHHLGAWAGDPAALCENEEFLGVLQECLEKLPPRLADVFLLTEQHRLPAEALGKVLGTSATNIHVMLFRARSALRICLNENYFQER